MNQSSSFGGRPRSGQHNNHNGPANAHAHGPAFSQEARFFPSQSTNGSGPRNNGRPGNSWHSPNYRTRNYNHNYNSNHNPNSNHTNGRWDDNFHGQRQGPPRPRNGKGNQNFRPGNNYYNERVANQRQPRMASPRSGQCHSPSYSNSRDYQANQPFPPHGGQFKPQGRRRGGRNRRLNRNQPMHLRAASPSRVSQCDVFDNVDRDGDVYMPDAPPLDLDGLYALHYMTYVECT